MDGWIMLFLSGDSAANKFVSVEMQVKDYVKYQKNFNSLFFFYPPSPVAFSQYFPSTFWNLTLVF